MRPEYVQAKLSRAASHSVEVAAAHARYLDQLKAYHPLPAGARVLDIACGAGEWLSCFRKEDVRMFGVDLHFDFVQFARDAERNAGHEIGAVQADGTALPFLDGCFDVVTAFNLLEHVADWKKLVTESLRVLRPGGVFWATTTNRLCPVTEEIRGFPLFPWYPARVRSAVLKWVQANRPELVGYSATPAVHWFEHGELIEYFRTLGCFDSAGFLDYFIPEGGVWKHIVLEVLRSSALSRTLFDVVHPGLGVLTRKSAGDGRDGSQAGTSADRTEPLLGSVLACPQCHRAVSLAEDRASCGSCGLVYAVRSGIPVMTLAEASSEVSSRASSAVSSEAA